MEITKQMVRLYDISYNGKDNLQKIKKIMSESAKKWIMLPKDPDEVKIGDLVVPLRGMFEGIPLYVKDTAGLRKWLDEEGNVAGESRFFTVETIYEDTNEPTGLTLKIPIALLK